MFVINGYIRVSYADNSDRSVILDSLRAEMSSRHVNEPTEKDYFSMGNALVDKLSMMLQCQLRKVVCTDFKKLSVITDDIRHSLSLQKRGTTKMYKFDNAVIRVTYRLRQSAVSASRAQPDLVFSA